MLSILYLKPKAPLALRFSGQAPNENQVHNLYRIVHRFKEDLTHESLAHEENPTTLLDKVFLAMQEEEWASRQSKKEFLDTLGIDHVSMKPGDMVYCDSTKELWMLDSLGGGFKKLILFDEGTNQPLSDKALEGIVFGNNALIHRVETSHLIAPPPSPWKKFVDAQKEKPWTLGG